MNPKSPVNQTIAERAYCLWEQAGRPAGRDEEFWLRAESELAAPAHASGVPPVIPPPLPAFPFAAAAAPAHQIPPPLKPVVKTRRRAPR
jgi:Protein of unknown function (DUF2934)